MTDPQEQAQKYEPLSEAELVEIEMEVVNFHELKPPRDVLRLIATIRDLQGQNEQMRRGIAKVLAEYAEMPGRGMTVEYFKDIMADTIVRG